MISTQTSPLWQLKAAIVMGYATALEKQRRQAGLGDLLAGYRGNPILFITEGLRLCTEDSWRNWLIVLRAAYGQGYTFNQDELAFFKSIAGGRNPPKNRVKELWLIVGRRGGKDSIASLIAVDAARFADCVALRPGERALIPCFATDRDQAGIVFNYIKGYFEEIPRLQSWLAADLPNSYRSGPIQLKNRTDIQVTTNNYRAPRGRPIATALFDEVAFWRSEDSATPDIETYRAVIPGMATVPDAMLVGISSPHKRSGLLFNKYDALFGKEDDNELVIQAPTRVMNPKIDEINPGLIDQAMEDDPDLALAEYFAEFRRDLADYVQREVVDACTLRKVTRIEPIPGVQYMAFVDPSGGSADSMTMAIGHLEGSRGILDALFERRAPFAPSEVVAEFCEALKPYGVNRVTGDRYAGEWPREQFAIGGVIYEPSEASKSDIYRDFLPMMNSVRCQLLDVARLKNQLLGLERRTIRGGRDSIDHAPGALDDLINAAAGVLVMVAGDERTAVVSRYLQALAS